VSAAGNAERLRLELVGKRWPSGQTVLGSVRFSLSAGEVVALSGPSGCGKSTLLSILAGLDHDYTGHLEWFGGPRLGVVFQTPRLLPWRTAVENVALGLGGKKDIRGRALQALAEVGLAEAADSYPSRLSQGMAHRVALARTLITEPDVLLLDEAFASLDETAANALRADILARVAARGMAVLMVTHDPRDSRAMADRLLRLDGTPARLVETRILRTASKARAGAPHVIPTFGKPAPSPGAGFSPP
jgi:NitT/TauT family transport system ATP-binding protein